MKWWARSSLRTKIFVAFAALVLAVLIAALGFTQFVLSREAQRTVTANLRTYANPGRSDRHPRFYRRPRWLSRTLATAPVLILDRRD